MIDSATNTVVATFGARAAAGGLDVTADGRFLYVANQVSNDASVIDTVTGVSIATVPTGQDPTAFGIFIAEPPAPDRIPTLGEWGLVALAALIGGASVVVMRKKQAQV